MAITSEPVFPDTVGGDLSGQIGSPQVTDDSHNHTGLTISGLGVSNFTSQNISQWTNDSGYLTSGSLLTGINDGAVLFANTGAFDGDVTNFHFNDSTKLLTLGGNLTLSSLTGTITAHAIKGDATDGIFIKSASGTNIGNLGAGDTANATWYGSHNFDSVTASRLAAFGSGKTLSSVASLTSWIAGTANRVTVNDDADGTVTLTTPQDTATTSDVGFNSVTTSVGYTITPGSDITVQALTVNVTGTPRVTWNETADAFSVNKGLIAAGTFGFDCTPSSDVDTDLLTINVTGTPRLYWDESEDCIRDTHGLIIDTYLGIRRTPNTSFPLTLQGFSVANDILAMYDSSGNQQWHIGLTSGGTDCYIIESSVANRLILKAGGNMGINAESFGGGTGGIICIGNCSAAPSSNPTASYDLYSLSGSLRGRGSSGTVTTIGPADPHCPVCGSDFGWEWHNDQYGGNLRICAVCLIAYLGNPSFARWNEVGAHN
jgi:hypothetical protein